VSDDGRERQEPNEVRQLHSELREMKDKLDRLYSAQQLTPFPAATATVATDKDTVPNSG